jgi:phosphohistidine phosphatase SixA
MAENENKPNEKAKVADSYLFSNVIFLFDDDNIDKDNTIIYHLREKGGVTSKKKHDVTTEIKAHIDNYNGTCNGLSKEEKKAKWVDCAGNCDTVVKKNIDTEINSTAYILNAIAESIISSSENKDAPPTITFKITVKLGDNKLTGIWSNDSKYIQIVSYGNDTQKKTSRLIMGFGPSSSGKTFLTKQLLQLLSLSDAGSASPAGASVVADPLAADPLAGSAGASAGDKFPDAFFSIDGGIYRECSLAYKFIVNYINSVKDGCVAGFTNLAEVSPLSKPLFESNSIKTNITTYFQKEKDRGVNISLYVPHTLGGCGILPICSSQYNDFLKITKDEKNWVGLLIWQHKFGKDCIYPDKYKCKGCSESGAEREKKEGKKYSNSQWDTSMKNGMEELMKAPGGRFKIHNSGGADRLSIIENYSDAKTSDKIRQVFLTQQEGKQYSYVDKYNENFDSGKTVKVNVHYVRHGYSCANYKRDTSLIPGAQKFVIDPSLHCKGIIQAKKVGEYFKNKNKKIDRIGTSQLLRAIQTGLIIRGEMDNKDIPLQVIRHMNEKGSSISFLKDDDNIPKYINHVNPKGSFLKDKKIEVEFDTTEKSEYKKYIESVLPDMVVKSKQIDDKQEYNFIIVSHSSLLQQMHKELLDRNRKVELEKRKMGNKNAELAERKAEKLNNGQSFVIHYVFSKDGLMLQETLETLDETAEKKKKDPSYSSRYPFDDDKTRSTCDSICKREISSDNITDMIDTAKLLEYQNEDEVNPKAMTIAQNSRVSKKSPSEPSEASLSLKNISDTPTKQFSKVQQDIEYLKTWFSATEKNLNISDIIKLKNIQTRLTTYDNSDFKETEIKELIGKIDNKIKEITTKEGAIPAADAVLGADSKEGEASKEAEAKESEAKEGESEAKESEAKEGESEANEAGSKESKEGEASKEAEAKEAEAKAEVADAKAQVADAKAQEGESKESEAKEAEASKESKEAESKEAEAKEGGPAAPAAAAGQAGGAGEAPESAPAQDQSNIISSLIEKIEQYIKVIFQKYITKEKFNKFITDSYVSNNNSGSYLLDNKDTIVYLNQLLADPNMVESTNANGELVMKRADSSEKSSDDSGKKDCESENNQIAELENKLKDAEANLHKALEAQGQSALEAQGQSAQEAQSRKKIDEKEKELSDKQRELDDKQKQLDEKEKELEDVKKTMEEGDNVNDELRKELDDKYKTLQEEKENLERNVKDLSSKVDTLKSEISEFEYENSKLRDESYVKDKELDDHREKCDVEIAAAKKEAEEANNAKTAMEEAMSKERISKEEELKKLRDELEKANNESDKMVTEAKSEAEQAKNESDKALKELAQAKAELDSIKENLKKTQEEKTTLEAQLKDSNESSDEKLTNQLDQVNKRITELRLSNESAETKISEAEERARATSELLKKKESDLQSLIETGGKKSSEQEEARQAAETRAAEAIAAAQATAAEELEQVKKEAAEKAALIESALAESEKKLAEAKKEADEIVAKALAEAEQSKKEAAEKSAAELAEATAKIEEAIAKLSEQAEAADKARTDCDKQIKDAQAAAAEKAQAEIAEAQANAEKTRKEEQEKESAALAQSQAAKAALEEATERAQAETRQLREAQIKAKEEAELKAKEDAAAQAAAAQAEKAKADIKAAAARAEKIGLMIENMERIKEKIEGIDKKIKDDGEKVASQEEVKKSESTEAKEAIITTYTNLKTEYENFKGPRCGQGVCDENKMITYYLDKSDDELGKDVITIQELLKRIINSSEDINGLVRIFVRVKGGTLNKPPTLTPLTYSTKVEEALGNKTLTLTNSNTTPPTIRTYSPFYDVFTQDKNNDEIFKEINLTLKQVLDGYHIALFGYGYSGSGKTYTLLNSPNNDPLNNDLGVLIRAVKYYITKGLTVKVTKISELYNNTYNFIGKIQEGSSSTIPINKYSDRIISSDDDFTTILNEIFKERKQSGRIKATINNKESSRGHLFITLDIGGKGQITVCDMAGREDPLEIWANTEIDLKTGEFPKDNEKGTLVNTITKRSLRTMMGSGIKVGEKGIVDLMIKDGIKNIIFKDKSVEYKLSDKIHDKVMEVIDTCREAHYINETLNHMIYFFDKLKSGVPRTFPSNEYNGESYIPGHIMGDIKNEDWQKTIGMIPMLEEIKKTTSGKPSKFCLFACVRQEATEKFKVASIKTLEYAQELASTKVKGAKPEATPSAVKAIPPMTVSNSAGPNVTMLANQIIQQVHQSNPLTKGGATRKLKINNTNKTRRRKREKNIKIKTRRTIKTKAKRTIKAKHIIKAKLYKKTRKHK